MSKAGASSPLGPSENLNEDDDEYHTDDYETDNNDTGGGGPLESGSWIVGNRKEEEEEEEGNGKMAAGSDDIDGSPTFARKRTASTLEYESPQNRHPPFVFMDDVVCLQCKRESHAPVSHCRAAQQWVDKQDPVLFTIPPEALEQCLEEYIEMVAQRLRLSKTAAALLCRREEWDWNRIRLQHYETQFRDRPGYARLRQAFHQQLRPNSPLYSPNSPLYSPNSPLYNLDEGTNFAMKPPPPQDTTQQHMNNHATAPDGQNMAAQPEWFPFGRPRRLVPLAAGTADSDLVKATTDSKLPADPTPDTNTFCPICMDDLPTRDDLLAMACGHAFCKDCWRGYVEQMLRETPQTSMSTTCPAQDCPSLVNRTFIQMVDPSFVPKFDQRQLASFVEGNQGTIRWCPGLDCDCAVLLPPQNFFPNEGGGRDDRRKNVFCESCQTAFCFQCGLAPHLQDCEQEVQPENEGDVAAELQAAANAAAAAAADAAADAMRREATHQLGNTRDDKLRKHCPKCNVLVEKIGGCNRMICQCKHPFCWLCLGDYPSYGGHFCGRMPEEAVTILPFGQGHGLSVDLDLLRNVAFEHQKNDSTRIVLKRLRALDRYVHYFTRYLAHDQGQRFAEQQCPCLKNRAENYKKMTGIYLKAEVDFLQSANKTLVASRRMLKYAYCCVYHSKRIDGEGGSHSHLGFLHIERLERFTEELSEVTENAVTRKDRKRVLDLIAVVKQCMRAVRDFEALESVLPNRTTHTHTHTKPLSEKEQQGRPVPQKE
eukprot:CAMPEP_0113460356 /NCGR_PEP_ID=MMETSP0014_2-20120614/10942_1 /TAXON_ID=2857 /ORGANISM="Nitzschia sp." /LENGTH=765 /DNA_ID=CAMNT_0000352001 /DNA_START=86 /DNA_END=2380 /DNA_ORIENTATION=+ /assembly_acc=CAM_ASM_000159